jgi:gliding motility-associated-like protein
LPINIIPVQQLVTQPRYNQPNRIIILKDSPIVFTNTNPSSYLYNFYDANSLLTKTISNGSFVVRPTQDTSFSMRTQRGSCFSNFAQFSIKVIPDAEVNIVNAFSPNGDGVNDFLQLQVKGVFVLKHFEIFNRYGQLLFETNRQDKIWTGKVNGNDLPVGTYYYILEGSNYFGKQILLKGSITLLR